MSKRIAVILSGCGYKDGAEATESVSCFVALSQEGVDFKVFAPDMDVEVTNHITGESQEDRRNLLVESSRLSRQAVKNLTELDSSEFDGLVIPGGFGAAQHLCDFASKGAMCKVHPEVKRVIVEFHEQSKPIGAFCIAPVLLAKVLGSHNVAVTIGNDKETATEIEKSQAQHVECKVDDFVSDRENKVITSPAYMYDAAKPHEVFSGIQKAIKELVEMA